MEFKGQTALILIFILLILGTIGFSAYRYISVQSSTPSPIPLGLATPDPNLPVLTDPASGAKVSSPLTVKGTVPPGWMFEGVFPIELTDVNSNVIATASAKEVTPGSWQSGSPVSFTATLTFTTTQNSGYLILTNDNPSGDPLKDQTYQIPVSF